MPLAVVAAGVVGDRRVSGVRRAATGPRAPLTFDEAKAQGKDVDWGPNCDTTTGKVAVPSGYAPPCVEPWKGGDNGGATAPGVTADTITVALYQAQPDLLQQAFFENTGSDESLGQGARDHPGVRRLLLRALRALRPQGRARHREGQRRARRRRRGQGRRDQGRHRGEGVRVVRRPGPDRPRTPTSSRRGGVLCVGDCVIAEPQSFLDRSTRRTCGRRSRHRNRRASTGPRSSATQLAKGKAVHAGRRELQRSTRVFGVVHYDDDAGTFRQERQALRGSARRRTA